MNRVIEGLRGDELLHGNDTIFVEHQRTEDRLFEFGCLRRQGATHFGQSLKSLTIVLYQRFVLLFRHRNLSVGGVKV